MVFSLNCCVTYLNVLSAFNIKTCNVRRHFQILRTSQRFQIIRKTYNQMANKFTDVFHFLPNERKWEKLTAVATATAVKLRIILKQVEKFWRTRPTTKKNKREKQNDNDTSHANRNTHVAHFQVIPYVKRQPKSKSILLTGKYWKIVLRSLLVNSIIIHNHYQHWCHFFASLFQQIRQYR